MDKGAWKTTVHGIARVRHDLALSFFFLTSSLPYSIPFGRDIFFCGELLPWAKFSGK